MTDIRYSAVYFIGAPKLGLVKIGIALEHWKRFRDIQTASPVDLEMLGVKWDRVGRTVAREKELHAKFAKYRVRGEWFHLREPIQFWIADHCDPYDANEQEVLDAIGETLGHKDAATTKRYAHLSGDRQLAVAEDVAASRRKP